LDRDHGNLRAALRFAQDSDPQLLISLCEALWPFWELRGHWDEGRRALATALTGAKGDDHRAARILVAAGALAANQGHVEEAAPLLQRALAAFRALGDEEQIANTLRRLGFCAAHHAEYHLATVYLE